MNDELIKFSDVSVGYGETVIQSKLNFTINRGTVFVIMGPSGCGKSTVLRTLSGLLDVQQGIISWFGQNFSETDEDARLVLKSRFGMLFQKGALWSSMTIAENVELPLRFFTDQSAAEMRDTAEERLSRVGLADAKDKFPAELSGGMQKRAGLARAMALDPEVLLLDEPSAGLDPISSRRLDDLILSLKSEKGKTFVVVTHELPSIFAIADDSIFLDDEQRTALAQGKPADLLRDSKIPKLQSFLRREAEAANGER